VERSLLCPAGLHCTAASAQQQQQVQWPKVSQKTLQLDDIENKGFIFLAPGSLTPTEAQRVVETAERIGFTHQSSRGPAFGEAFRDNDRISVEDPALAHHLWESTGLQEAMQGMKIDFESPCGLNKNIRIYRYVKGQRFGRHIDESTHCGHGNWTKFTLLIYLSSCGGGETMFYGLRRKRPLAVTPSPGLALLHLHGEDCLEHEGAAVTSGVKYVLRSDVVFKRDQGM
jgi:hypothetical protein